VQDEEIHALVTRLARPNRSGGSVIECAAIFAEGADFAEVMAWIVARGGIAETVAITPSRGLHSERHDARSRIDGSKPRRFVLPPGALTP
jgi:hypothetical protein